MITMINYYYNDKIIIIFIMTIKLFFITKNYYYNDNKFIIIIIKE